MWINNEIISFFMLISMITTAVALRHVIATHPFDENMANFAIDAHNDARTSVSPTASNMRRMEWDEELVQLALDQAQQKCTSKRIRTSSFRHSSLSYIGRNTHISFDVPFSEDYVREVIDSWNNEKEDYDYERNICFKRCRHYTQMVWGSSYRIGCAAVECSSRPAARGSAPSNAMVMVCNYGPGGNILGQKPYTDGTACTNCPISANRCFEGLCY